MSDEKLNKFIADEMDRGSKLFKGAVCKVLKDVRAEIEAKMESIIDKYDSSTSPRNMPSRKIERNNGRIEAIDIINRKIAEATKNE